MLLLVELVLTLLLIGATARSAVVVRRRRAESLLIAASNERLDHVLDENERVAKAARDVAAAVETTTTAVELGTGIVRASHEAIAAIPFDVLDSIPATRAASKLAREIHDETAAGVYRAISGVNKAIGDAFKTRTPRT
ncbi:hypothetical protein FOS14_23140 [Skermania sp. ID1734]|uniref:hypothetical protein n=1 Tax=Skermania sp. ID1734 TaxID=2597516 RepID=UPI00117E2807|nr:hypothetical protein [Skermania sp. ID1734]TSD93450.1 hypothetical protein FOS14_23140 [Skermania sp. ID1734]